AVRAFGALHADMLATLAAAQLDAPDPRPTDSSSLDARRIERLAVASFVAACTPAPPPIARAPPFVRPGIAAAVARRAGRGGSQPGSAWGWGDAGGGPALSPPAPPPADVRDNGAVRDLPPPGGLHSGARRGLAGGAEHAVIPHAPPPSPSSAPTSLWTRLALA